VRKSSVSHFAAVTRRLQAQGIERRESPGVSERIDSDASTLNETRQLSKHADRPRPVVRLERYRCLRDWVRARVRCFKSRFGH
jgi:hypothetical protein